MRRLTVLAIAVCSLSLSAPSASAGLVCTRTMTIENFRYVPATAAKVAQADLIVICWHNEDGVNHTATSNDGLFDTNAIAPGAETGRTLFGAGTYRYHCEIHPSMAGSFNVRPAASATSISVGGTFTLTVGPSGALIEAPTWDVQRRRNDGPWIQFKTGTTQPTFDVQPLRAGTFRYRARTNVSGQVSGWSPVRIVTVSVP
jgi:plastocyanin